MTILETFIKLRDDLKAWVTNNLNQKANISYVDEKFDSIAEFDPTEIQEAIDANTAAIDTKVDKVEGKDLSTNDYTTAEKDKLSTVEPNANFYEHPVHDSHSSGLYKITVDGEGHVSEASLVEKEDMLAFVEKDDIVNLGFMDEDSVSSKISDLNDRIDGVEGSLNTTNETLNGFSEEFENYKTTNNGAVSTNTSNIEINRIAIKEIQSDYLTSANQILLQDGIDEVSKKATANATAIEKLNGDGEGSVKQSIDKAFTEFKEDVIAGINTRIGTVETDLSDYEGSVSDQFSQLSKTVNDINDSVEEIESEFTNYKEHVNSKLAEVDDLQLNFTSHAENKENPHEVTAEQVGTYTKDQIQNIITIEDIDNICRSNISSDENIDIVSMATQYWVEQYYQKKGNYLTNTDMTDHNVSTSAHNDIRLLIENLSKDLYTLADCDDETLDQMHEVVDYIKNNTSLIEGITISKVSVSDIIDNLTTNVSNKPLSAAQGFVLKNLIEALRTEIDGKIVETDSTLSTEHAPADAKAVGDEIKNLNNTKVPTTRKINGKPLSEDINLTAEDIGVTITTDKNLTVEGMPADAKAVRDALSDYAQVSTVDTLQALIGNKSVANQIAEALDDVSNVVKYDVAQDLTDEQKAQARANIGVDDFDFDFDFEVDEISVQLGENGTIGGYKTGDVIAAGTDIKVILNKLFQKAVAATYTKPALSLSNNGGTANGNIEAGSSISPKLRASFVNNDSGGLTDIKIMQGGTSVANGTTTPLDYNGSSIIIGDETITFTASADYSAAPVKNNNLGEESKENWFADGTVTSNAYSITGSRQLFCGTGAGALPTITSDIVRGLSGKRLSPANGNSFKINVAVGQQYIIIAYPKSLRDVNNITYVEANDSGMASNFTKYEIQVADARGGTNGLVDYKVYTYAMAVPAAAPMTFKFTI